MIPSLIAKYLGGWIGYLVVGLVAFIIGIYIGYRWELGAYNGLKAANAEVTAAAIQAAKDKQSASDQITLKKAVFAATEKQKIISNTGIIVNEIPQNVTPKQDNSNCITYGFVRVLDAAVLKVDPNSLPLSPGLTVDTCSPIKASALAESISRNFGQGNQAIIEDKVWRDWYQQQSASWNKK